jgi:hypothetical protein
MRNYGADMLNYGARERERDRGVLCAVTVSDFSGLPSERTFHV